LWQRLGQVRDDPYQIRGITVFPIEIEQADLANVFGASVGSDEKQVALVEPVLGELLGADVGAFHRAVVHHPSLNDLVHAEDFVADTGLVHLLIQAVLDVGAQFGDFDLWSAGCVGSLNKSFDRFLRAFDFCRGACQDLFLLPAMHELRPVVCGPI
jgi:hypothetical protein